MSKRAWWFAFAVAVQVLILIAVPAQKMYTRVFGRTVVLQVAPVDPYSLLSGYYVTLGYAISPTAAFPNQAEPGHEGTVYAVIEQGVDGVWKPVRLDETLPRLLPPNQAAIRGHIRYGRIEYGIEEFYIPESKRTVLADDLRQHTDAARAEVKVDARGNVALVRLRIEDRVYED